MDGSEDVASFCGGGKLKTPWLDGDNEFETQLADNEDDKDDGVEPEPVTVPESSDTLPTPAISGDELMASDSAELVGERDDVVIAPKVGMMFSDPDAIYDFYRRYAHCEGFPIRKRSSRKGDDGELRYVSLECSRAGQRPSTAKTIFQPRPTKQTHCQARICAVSDLSGGWRLNTVKLEHNHKCSPSKSRLYRCNRVASAAIKRQVILNDKAGIRLNKTFEAAASEAGGYDKFNCIEKDCYNYSAKARRLRLGEGDAAALQAYFVRMQSQCPGFFFSIDLDDKGRLRNIFWADNRSRQAYKEFGDVVSFDTTYLVNKYEMPLAVFVGVNHHGQSTLFGCGLLAYEEKESFVWLFTNWLQCMGGTAPSAIITDQDLAMKAAIPLVFPETKHRWCLWHIMKKLPDKFGGRVDKDVVMEAIKRVVYDSYFPEEFEEEWAAMIDKYQLGGNRWCLDMYAERTRWVPCYLKTSFWAGMSTTQRSESVNAFFDGFVNSKTTLKQFVEQYDRALMNNVEKELQADHKSFEQVIPCATPFGIEKQFQQVYTQKKFKEFQKELALVASCRIDAKEDDYPGTKYHVFEQIALGGDYWKRKEFLVSFVRDDLRVSCNCHQFEFRGIVCRHVMKVLVDLDVHKIHERYILRRWRKEVHRAHSGIVVGNDGWLRTPEQERFDQVLTTAEKLAQIVAPDEQQCRGVIEWMENQLRDLSITCIRTVASTQCIDKNVCPESCSGRVEESSTASILDPKLVHCKGTPRRLQLNGPLEKEAKKAKVSSQAKATNTPLVQTSNVDLQATTTTQGHQEVVQTGDVVLCNYRMLRQMAPQQPSLHSVPPVLPDRTNELQPVISTQSSRLYSPRQ